MSPKGEREFLVRAALVMGVAVAIWTAALAPRLEDYFVPIFSAAVQSARTFLMGTGHHIFGASGGTPPTPYWERVVLVVYTVSCTLAALVCAWIMLSRAIHKRDRMLGLLGALNLAFPITAASHFDPSVGELGNRAATFLFLPLALSCSLIIMRHPRVARSPIGTRNLFRPAMLIALIGGTSIIYLGGILLGSSPDWIRLPGPYLPSADFRTQDPETLAAVDWAATHLPAGSTVAADRVPAVLLESEARLWPVNQPQQGFTPSQLYFSATWGPQETAIVKGLHIDYLYVDTRLANSLPMLGYYFAQGETAQSTRITVADVSKFAHVQGLTAVYHHGPVTIYDTSWPRYCLGMEWIPGLSYDGRRAFGCNSGREFRSAPRAIQKTVGMDEIDCPGHRRSRDHVGYHSCHHFRRWRTLRPSHNARSGFHPGRRCNPSRDLCSAAPNGRPETRPAAAFPAQTGPACPSWSRGWRGRPGDCYLCRVDHRCRRRQCDPPGCHLASIFMGVDGRR